MRRLDSNVLFESGHLSRDLARKSVRGGVATMTGQGIQFALNTAGTVVLARLLTPADFGLIGMVTVVTGFLEMFKTAGLSTATVQQEYISREQVSVLFWVNVLISIGLGLFILAGSPLVAMLYRRQELTLVTAALSLPFIMNGLTIQHRALLRRHMRFGALRTILIASQVVNIGTTVALAAIGWRYWALVSGTVVGSIATMALTFYHCSWVPGSLQKGTGARKMLAFGGHVTGFNFVNYFARNADNLLIGRFIGAQALGLYSKAYGLFMMPMTQIRNPLNEVAMPALSSLRNQPERYARYYRRLLDTLSSLAFPLSLYCMLEAGFLIRAVLGRQWLGAVPVFRILAVVGPLQVISGAAGLVMLSLGLSKRYLIVGIVSSCIYVASFVVGLSGGIQGVAGAYVLANAVLFVPFQFICLRGSPVNLGLALKAVLWPLCISLTAAACAGFARHYLVGDTFAGHIVVLGIFAAVVLGGSLCRKTTRETLELLKANLWPS
jgi:O-antigen/teichoic acid export membrane protein